MENEKKEKDEKMGKIGSALQVTPGGNQVDGLPPAASKYNF